MPLYDFYNKKTKKSFEKFLKIADMEQYLKDNPHIIREFNPGSSPAVIDPVRLGIRKADSGFREIIKQVHDSTPGSQLNKTTHF